MTFGVVLCGYAIEPDDGRVADKLERRLRDSDRHSLAKNAPGFECRQAAESAPRAECTTSQSVTAEIAV